MALTDKPLIFLPQKLATKMKKLLLWTFSSLLFIVLASATIYELKPKSLANDKAIKWYTIEEALEARKANPKKLFIDTYTDWCGWCKVMDRKTFTDPDVIRFLNENFYAVKFNAEQKESIDFQGHTYKYVVTKPNADPKREKGIHELAYTLLDRRTSYPSFVLLDEGLGRMGIIKGYKAPETFLPLLKQNLGVQ